MLYKLPQDNWVAENLAAQQDRSRAYGFFPGAAELRGSLRGSGSAHQCASTVQASMFPAASMFQASTVDVVTSGVHVSQADGRERVDVVFVGASGAGAPRVGGQRVVRPAPQAFAQREYNSTLGNAEIANVEDGRASKLILPRGVAAPIADESHFVSPSDCIA